jgi:hypothetical protein
MDGQRKATEEGERREWNATIATRRDTSPPIAGQKVVGRKERVQEMQRGRKELTRQKT